MLLPLPQCLFITAAKYREQLEAYLGGLEGSKVQKLQELIDFNTENADLELPSSKVRRNVNGETLTWMADYPGQEFLEQAQKDTTTAERFDKLVADVRNIGKTEGLDKSFQQYDIDVIIGPAESPLTTFAAAAGYPIASLPLGYLDFNGRPHGLCAVAKAHEDAILIQLQSAWDASFSPRKTLDCNSLPRCKATST